MAGAGAVATATAADWSGLVRDILELIVRRLITVSDNLTFSAVCSSWRSVAVENRCYLPHQYPGLIFPGRIKKSKTRRYLQPVPEVLVTPTIIEYAFAPPEERYSAKRYLVESKSELYLVVRTIRYDAQDGVNNGDSDNDANNNNNDHNKDDVYNSDSGNKNEANNCNDIIIRMILKMATLTMRLTTAMIIVRMMLI
ncbi:hypothetical protein FRX31_010865 [Thalictrum thalictroides]|uniref:F-box protein n=1 Tax=Thalictrum thalictroides TaxID=46969 RepID=A0A7J6WRG9_THATH|nr:hypothetical protein FRX31_010865 [Thalictrum thalictroides]